MLTPPRYRYGGDKLVHRPQVTSDGTPTPWMVCEGRPYSNRLEGVFDYTHHIPTCLICIGGFYDAAAPR